MGCNIFEKNTEITTKITLKIKRAIERIKLSNKKEITEINKKIKENENPNFLFEGNSI